LSAAANLGSGGRIRPSTGLSAAAARQGLASLTGSLAGGGLSSAANVGAGGSSRLFVDALEVGSSAAAAVSAEGGSNRPSASTLAAGCALSDGRVGLAAAVEAPYLQSVEGRGGSPSPVLGTVSGRGPRSKAVVKLRANTTTPANVLRLLERWDAMPARERERVWRRVGKRRRTHRARFPDGTWSALVGHQSPFKGRHRHKGTSTDKCGDSSRGREVVGIAGDGGGGGAADGGAGRADPDGVAAGGGRGQGGDGVRGGGTFAAGDALCGDGGPCDDGHVAGGGADGRACGAADHSCGRSGVGCGVGSADGVAGGADEYSAAGVRVDAGGAGSAFPGRTDRRVIYRVSDHAAGEQFLRWWGQLR